MANTRPVGVAYSDPVIDGGTIDNAVIGGTTAVAGTFSTMTCTTAVVGGNTLSGTELGYVDGITPGTVAVNKAIVPTTNKHIDALVISDGGLALGSGAGTAITATGAEINVLAGVTAGTTAPEKALVLDAAESLNWATTDATASETCTLTVTDTRTGAGAVGWAAKFDLEANVALGSYANAAYGYLALGASGKVTGLGAGVCGEIVLSAGCVDGTYACIEAEMGMPSGAKTGTAASFMYLSLYGADASTFDTNGYLMQVAGLTKNTGKCYADATTGSTARPVEVLRVLVDGNVRYLPLYDTVAIAA